MPVDRPLPPPTPTHGLLHLGCRPIIVFPFFLLYESKLAASASAQEQGALTTSNDTPEPVEQKNGGSHTQNVRRRCRTRHGTDLSFCRSFLSARYSLLNAVAQRMVTVAHAYQTPRLGKTGNRKQNNARASVRLACVCDVFGILLVPVRAIQNAHLSARDDGRRRRDIHRPCASHKLTCSSSLPLSLSLSLWTFPSQP